MGNPDVRRDRIRRGIFLLPNLFTTLNLLCGFYAVIAAMDGKFVIAATTIIVAGVFDSLDGKIARWTRTTSQFGVEYDSLADVVSFGMAPALLMVMWCLQPLGRLGWLSAFLFMACGALRLARFNVQAGASTGDRFTGLPIPAAAGMVAVTVLFCNHVGLVGTIHPIVFAVMMYMLAFLMVSTFKYHSFKRGGLRRRMTLNYLAIVLMLMLFVAYQPEYALFLIGVAYVSSGPLIYIRKHRGSDPDLEIAIEGNEPVKP